VVTRVLYSIATWEVLAIGVLSLSRQRLSEGIQGVGPQIFIWGAGSPKKTDHGVSSLPSASPPLPPCINIKKIN
jgi:hypothetical protein